MIVFAKTYSRTHPTILTISCTCARFVLCLKECFDYPQSLRAFRLGRLSAEAATHKKEFRIKNCCAVHNLQSYRSLLSAGKV